MPRLAPVMNTVLSADMAGDLAVDLLHISRCEMPGKGQVRLGSSRHAGRRGASGSQALDLPALGVPGIAQPVVQAVGPALPELDALGHQPVAAPERRGGGPRAPPNPPPPPPRPPPAR